MVASMVATILTTFTASKETAKTDTVRIHRLPDLEIKLLSASALSSLGLCESLLPLLMLIWKLEVTFVHSQTKVESALESSSLLRSALLPCRILYAEEVSLPGVKW